MMNDSPDSLFARDEPGAIPVVAGLVILAVGVAIGAAAALLTAPKSGNGLRADLATRAGNVKANVLDAIAQSKERLVTAVEASRTQPPHTNGRSQV